jgi:hypothetical protein
VQFLLCLNGVQFLLPQGKLAGLVTFFIYGGIMNPAAALMFLAQPTIEMFYLAYIRGIPFDLVHVASTVVFLYSQNPCQKNLTGLMEN